MHLWASLLWDPSQRRPISGLLPGYPLVELPLTFQMESRNPVMQVVTFILTMRKNKAVPQRDLLNQTITGMWTLCLPWNGFQGCRLIFDLGVTLTPRLGDQFGSHIHKNWVSATAPMIWGIGGQSWESWGRRTSLQYHPKFCFSHRFLARLITCLNFCTWALQNFWCIYLAWWGETEYPISRGANPVLWLKLEL